MRETLLVPADGAWHAVWLPLAEDWNPTDAAAVTLTGLRLVHYREGAGTGRFATAFARLRVRAAPTEQ